MTGLWDTAVLVALLVTWLSSPSSSLAEVAEREAVRRQLTQASQASLSNITLPPPRPSDIAPAETAAAAGTAGGTDAANGEADDEPAAEANAAEAGTRELPGSGEPSGGGELSGGGQLSVAGAGTAAGGAPAESPEQTWRERAAALRLAIVTDAATERDLESRVARLEREATSRDDPAQRAVLIDQLARARADLARAREKSRADAAAAAAMQEEARRAGVPPGWLR